MQNGSSAIFSNSTGIVLERRMRTCRKTRERESECVCWKSLCFDLWPLLSDKTLTGQELWTEVTQLFCNTAPLDYVLNTWMCMDALCFFVFLSIYLLCLDALFIIYSVAYIIFDLVRIAGLCPSFINTRIKQGINPLQGELLQAGSFFSNC